MGLFSSTRGGQAQLASTAFDKKITVPDDDKLLSLMSLPLTQKTTTAKGSAKDKEKGGMKALPGRIRDTKLLEAKNQKEALDIAEKHQKKAEESGNVEEYLKTNWTEIEEDMAPIAATQLKIESNKPLLEKELEEISKYRSDKDYMSTPYLSSDGSNISVEFAKPLTEKQIEKFEVVNISGNRYLMPFEKFGFLKGIGENTKYIQESIKSMDDEIRKEKNEKKKEQLIATRKSFEEELKGIHEIIGTDEDIAAIPSFKAVEGSRTLSDFEQIFGLTKEGDIQSVDWGTKVEQSKEISEANKMFENVAATEVVRESYPGGGMVDGIPVLMSSTITKANNYANIDQVALNAYNSLTTNQKLAFQKEYLRDASTDDYFMYYEGVKGKDKKGKDVVIPTPVYKKISSMSFDQYIHAKLESAANINKRVTASKVAYDYSILPEYIGKAEVDKTKTTLYSITAAVTELEQVDPEKARRIFVRALGGVPIQIGDRVINESIKPLRDLANSKSSRDAYIKNNMSSYNQYLQETGRKDTEANKTIYYQNSIKEGLKNIYKSKASGENLSKWEKFGIRFNLDVLTLGLSEWFIKSIDVKSPGAMGGILAIENYDAYEIPLTPEYNKTYTPRETLPSNVEIIANDGTVTNIDAAGIDHNKVVYVNESRTLIPNLKYKGAAQSAIKTKVMMPASEAEKLYMTTGIDQNTGEAIVGPNKGKIKYTTVKDSGLLAFKSTDKEGDINIINKDWVIVEIIQPVNSDHQHELAVNANILYGPEKANEEAARYDYEQEQLFKLEQARNGK